MVGSDTMGHTFGRFEFRAAGQKRTLALDLLVDTGSTYTWIDARVLRDLGVVPTGRWTFETIKGREASRRLGEAVVSYGAVQATTVVVFARRKDAQVLGVHALEGLRLAVDPATKRLRRLRFVLAILGRERNACDPPYSSRHLPVRISGDRLRTHRTPFDPSTTAPRRLNSSIA